MNQQQQDKAAFFAQYYPQNVMRHESYTDGPLIAAISVGNTSHYLELKPLSCITDEDVKVVLGIVGYRGYDYKETIEWLVILFSDPALDYMHGLSGNQIRLLIDFLRSRGYLIPFRNYSVDQILEMGWVKLKEK